MNWVDNLHKETRNMSLANGGSTILDYEDFERYHKHRWCGVKQRHSTYVKTNFKLPTGGYVNKSLHRMMLNPPKGLVVDHINHDALDNRRKNLRVCTVSENNRNKRIRYNSKTGVKGVYAQKDRFQANITADGRAHYLGSFKTKKEAARAYDDAAKKLHGEFAYLNNI